MMTTFPLPSDPYVLISQAGEALYRCHEKKKTVNPVWNDQTNLCIEDVFTPIVYEVVKHLTTCLLLSMLCWYSGVRPRRGGQ